jgi:hypothetical protein
MEMRCSLDHEITPVDTNEESRNQRGCKPSGSKLLPDGRFEGGDRLRQLTAEVQTADGT